MKHLIQILLALCLLAPLGLVAQTPPTVDTTSFPTVPDTLLFYVVDTTGQVAPGAAGANVTWDFSTQTTIDSQEVIWNDGAQQDTSGLFASSTHQGSVDLNVAGLTFTQPRFYTLSSGSFVENGYRQDSVDLTALAGFTAYSLAQEYQTDSLEGDTLYTLPLAFGDSTGYGLVKRNLAGEVNFGAPLQIEIRQESNRTVHADAWGSLSLPDTSFDSVLRVQTIVTTTDTIYYFNTATQMWEKATVLSPSVFSQVTYDTLYSWFVPSLGVVMEHQTSISVLSPDTSLTPGDTDRLYNLRYLDMVVASDSTQDTTDTTDTTTARLDARTLDALLYPQPSTGTFTVLLGELPQATVVELRLLDMQGRVVWREERALRNELQVNLPALAAGRYSLHLESGDKATILPVLLRP